jgi:hypothetical protein
MPIAMPMWLSLVLLLAWHYKQYQREQSENDRVLYDMTKSEARAARRGLWA